jgi:hypothetical protein
MKRYIFFSVVAVLILCCQAQAAIDRIDLRVEGMT